MAVLWLAVSVAQSVGRRLGALCVGCPAGCSVGCWVNCPGCPRGGCAVAVLGRSQGVRGVVVPWLCWGGGERRRSALEEPFVAAVIRDGRRVSSASASESVAAQSVKGPRRTMAGIGGDLSADVAILRVDGPSCAWEAEDGTAVEGARQSATWLGLAGVSPVEAALSWLQPVTWLVLGRSIFKRRLDGVSDGASGAAPCGGQSGPCSLAAVETSLMEAREVAGPDSRPGLHGTSRECPFVGGFARPVALETVWWLDRASTAGLGGPADRRYR